MLGRRETTVMAVVNLIDNLRRDAQFFTRWLLSSELRNEMSKNKELRDLHKGKRCFIIGNGPSLNHYDLNKLSNEYVFTVNNMMMTDNFKILKPNFHLFFDPEFFKYFFHLDPKDEVEKNKMDSINKTLELYPELKFFSSYRLKSTFMKLFPRFNSHFLFNNRMFTPLLKDTSSLSRNIPAFQNVIIYAINVAIYMGFDKIYLLGVDMTGFLEHYEYNTVNDNGRHFYDKSEEDMEKEKYFRNEKSLDNEWYLKAFGKIFEQFKLINKIAVDNNIKLMNASSHGGLDMVERVNFDEINFK